MKYSEDFNAIDIQYVDIGLFPYLLKIPCLKISLHQYVLAEQTALTGIQKASEQMAAKWIKQETEIEPAYFMFKASIGSDRLRMYVIEYACEQNMDSRAVALLLSND